VSRVHLHEHVEREPQPPRHAFDHQAFLADGPDPGADDGERQNDLEVDRYIGSGVDARIEIIDGREESRGCSRSACIVDPTAGS